MNLSRNPTQSRAALLALALVAATSAQAQDPEVADVLAPGVLVSAPEQAAVAWVADAQARVTAIDLADGRVLWRSAAEGLPLALHDRKLVVLARPKERGELSLLLLNPEDGSALGGVVGDLPELVLASPDPQPNRSFEASAVVDGGALLIRWSFAEWPLRGAKLLTNEPDGGRRKLAGAVAVDLAGSRLREASLDTLPAPRTPDLIGSERLANVDGTQLRAADDLHVLSASAVSDDLLGTQWRWSLHERSSGRSLGSVVLPYANAPFVLRGRQLLWRSEPMVVRQSSGSYLSHGARLVAQSLATGAELWSVELLDRTYKGLLPP